MPVQAVDPHVIPATEQISYPLLHIVGFQAKSGSANDLSVWYETKPSRGSGESYEILDVAATQHTLTDVFALVQTGTRPKLLAAISAIYEAIQEDLNA